jgi:hypothetical protein
VDSAQPTAVGVAVLLRNTVDVDAEIVTEAKVIGAPELNAALVLLTVVGVAVLLRNTVDVDAEIVIEAKVIGAPELNTAPVLLTAVGVAVLLRNIVDVEAEIVIEKKVIGASELNAVLVLFENNGGLTVVASTVDVVLLTEVVGAEVDTLTGACEELGVDTGVLLLGNGAVTVGVTKTAVLLSTVLFSSGVLTAGKDVGSIALEPQSDVEMVGVAVTLVSATDDVMPGRVTLVTMADDAALGSVNMLMASVADEEIAGAVGGLVSMTLSEIMVVVTVRVTITGGRGASLLVVSTVDELGVAVVGRGVGENVKVMCGTLESSIVDVEARRLDELGAVEFAETEDWLTSRVVERDAAELARWVEMGPGVNKTTEEVRSSGEGRLVTIGTGAAEDVVDSSSVWVTTVVSGSMALDMNGVEIALGSADSLMTTGGAPYVTGPEAEGCG